MSRSVFEKAAAKPLFNWASALREILQDQAADAGKRNKVASEEVWLLLI